MKGEEMSGDEQEERRVQKRRSEVWEVQMGRGCMYAVLAGGEPEARNQT